jgi:D-xylulose reductase
MTDLICLGPFVRIISLIFYYQIRFSLTFLSWQRGRIGDYIPTGPIALSHESSGVVVETGAKVNHLKPGDRVSMEPRIHVDAATIVAKGPTSSLSLRLSLHEMEHWQSITSISDFCYKMSETMNLKEAAMVEPVSVACAIAKTADIRAHQTVLVLGCGPIGVLCQAVAKAKTIVGVDVVQSRLDVTKS